MLLHDLADMLARRRGERRIAFQTASDELRAADWTVARAMGFKFTPGELAIDLVTGEEVEIVSAQRFHRIVQPPQRTID